MDQCVWRGAELCVEIANGRWARRRRWWRSFWSGLLALAALAGAQLPAQVASTNAATRLIVKPKATTKVDATSAIPGSHPRRLFRRLGNLQVIELPAGTSPQAAIDALKATKLFQYAEPDQVVQLQSTEPNDFRWPGGELWGLHNIGYLDGTPGADIKAPEAWDIRHDVSNIIVALVDSGLRLTHDDLAPNLWTNPRQSIVPYTVESDHLRAVVRVHRSGETRSALDVHLKVDGTATAGKDYDRLPPKVTIPAGQSYVDLDIQALPDRATEPVETIVLSLSAHPQYRLGARTEATVLLYDADAVADYFRRVTAGN